MFAQINHVAMVSSDWPLLGRFYEAAFGMRQSPTAKPRPLNGLTVGDGHVGLNINPRRDRYPVFPQPPGSRDRPAREPPGDPSTRRSAAP